MGKNQAYKAMQRAKMASPSATGGVEDAEDGMTDRSFHSPEWHAARLASLQTSHTVTWEEYKRRQKEEARRKKEEEDNEVRLMREYRAQLDAERAHKLSRGVNHAGKRAASEGRKEKDKKRKSSQRKRKCSSESQSDSEVSNEKDEKGLLRKDRQGSKRDKKGRKHRSRRKVSQSGANEASRDDKEHGPVPLSFYFDTCKS